MPFTALRLSCALQSRKLQVPVSTGLQCRHFQGELCFSAGWPQISPRLRARKKLWLHELQQQQSSDPPKFKEAQPQN